ncbi:MAG: hypothetical protein ACYC7E_02725 [Armatimonadota bacterium]
MRNAFSLLAFLCKVPVDLLEGYATQVGLTETLLGSSIPWCTIEALEADRRSMAVARVSFQLVFQRRQDRGRQVTRSFTLAVPNTHTYKRNDPFAPKIQELLKRWKIDVAHDICELAGPA